MQVNFRQGIIKAPTGFLDSNSGIISINASVQNQVIITFSDHATNYILTEKANVVNAWNVSFTNTSYTKAWIYWDINIITGEKTYGHTFVSPITSQTAPTSPTLDQHWFDKTSNCYKVWNGSNWIKKLRVFAAEVKSDFQLISISAKSPLFTGTQVGIINQLSNQGYIVYDPISNHPIKLRDGSFLTTEHTLLTGLTSSSRVRIGGLVIEARAVGNIPEYSIVRFTSFGKVQLATNHVIDNGTYGIIENAATDGEHVNIIMEGTITNPNWDWTSVGVNTPLYVDNIGRLTPTLPENPIIVAAVIDTHTILLRPSSLFIDTLNDPASNTNMGSVYLSSLSANPAQPTAVCVDDQQYQSVISHLLDDTSHLSPDQYDWLINNVNTNNSGGSGLTTEQQLILDNMSMFDGRVVIPQLDTNTVTAAYDMMTSDTGIFNMNMSVANGYHLIATSDTNIITSNFPNVIVSRFRIITLIIQQDSIGSHIITFDSSFKWVNGMTPNISQTADSWSIFQFYLYGSNLYEISRAINVA